MQWNGMVVNPRRGDVVWVWGLGDKKRGGSSPCPLKHQHPKPYKSPSWTAPKPTSELASIMSNTTSSSSSNSNNHHRRRKERGRRCPPTSEDDVDLGLSIGAAPPSDTTLFVKVYMEGQPIGRKLNMMAHTGYDHLIATLDHMFNANIILFLDDDDQHHYSHHHHVLTYQDDEGDWLMIGDVPWDLFLSSVKRLNISRAYPS